ncbi:hypothetical protein ACFWSF_03645 [Streptomyces sp. NPDC058611]|uniref:hypothetical protein n=1 Tax=unclassified Streptomyces TaxID=2593676 RepID=UPI0036493428
MSPTSGTIRHPDVSEISDLAEGLLSPARTTEVRRHLGDCALCADVGASLDEIRGLLGTLPGPARMPADIAGRIDAALAAEALLDAAKHPAPSPAAPRTDTAAPVVSRGTTSGSTPGTDVRRPSGHPVGPSGPGRRRARRRIAIITGLAGATACALGIFLFADLSGAPDQNTTSRGDAASSAAQPPAEDGTYTAGGLRDDVRELLASGPGAKTAPQEQNNTFGMENTSPAPGIAGGGDRAASAVPSCVQNGTGRPDTPLAAERGSYRGAPVYLLVLAHPGDVTRVDAYLVETACESAGADAPGKLLLSSTYPRS